MTYKLLAVPSDLWWFIPAAVIFALLAFGQVFGFFGVLLTLPASAALLVGLRYLGGHYRNSSLYKQ